MRLYERHPTAVRAIGALLLFTLVAVIWFPAVARHPGSRMACCVSDGTATIRDYWLIERNHENPITFKHDAFNGAPEGTDRAPAALIANAGLQTGFVWTLKGLLGLVGAWNAYMFLGLIGSAFAMYVLLQRLGCSLLASVFGGYVFGFWPFQMERAYAGHLNLLENWVFVLEVFAFIRLRERRSLRSAALVGLTIGLAFYNSAYEGLFASVLALVFFAVEYPRKPERSDRDRTIGLAATAYVVAGMTLLPIVALYAGERSSVQSSAGRMSSDLRAYAARPLSYLLPSPNNPFFHWDSSIRPVGLTEQAIYFGYTTLFLGIAAIVMLFRRNEWLRETPVRWWTAWSMAVLAPTAFVLSFAPAYKIGSVIIPTPSIVIAVASTFWRAYARFGVLVAFGFTVLAALTLTAAAKRGGRVGRFLPPLALVLMVFELLPGSIGSFAANDRPGWVTWLQAHPHGIVATYPEVPAGPASRTFAASAYYFQRFDHDPGFSIVAASLPQWLGRPEAIRFIASNLRNPLTAGILAAEHVRYVVTNDNAYRTDHHAPPPLLARSLFTRRYHLGDISIYELHAHPANIAAALQQHERTITRGEGVVVSTVHETTGFGALRTVGASTGRPLARRGVIAVKTDLGIATQAELTGRVTNPGGARTLELRGSNGKLLGTDRISAGEGTFRMPPIPVSPRSSFRLMLVVRSSPGSGGAGTPETSLLVSGLALRSLPAYVPAPHAHR